MNEVLRSMGQMDGQTIRLPLYQMKKIYGDPKHPDFEEPGFFSTNMNFSSKKDD